jgi:hypothetical protein
MQKNVYDVALWRYWHADDLHYPESFPVVDTAVQADSPLMAALQLMEQYKIKRVARAAVGLPDHTVQRWEQGLSRYTGDAPIPDEEDTEPEEVTN